MYSILPFVFLVSGLSHTEETVGHQDWQQQDAAAYDSLWTTQVNKTEEPRECCKALENAGLASRILYLDSEAYTARTTSYWSLAAQLEPTCIIQPLTAEEVSLTVVTLVTANKSSQCHFAVRSGGHTTWAGAAGIENGVTVDLGFMNSTTYYAENSTAAVQPGARWNSVYSTLDKFGVAVAGGRAGNVGVAGLILGGGNSFYAGRKGLVCDNVANFQVVLGSGEIVDANPTTNSDLFKALKGGSNNFGIVTRFDLIAFEATKIWGGLVVYPNDTTLAHLEAMKNFADRVEDDPYASVIGIWQYMSHNDATIIIEAYDYTREVERPKAYNEFLAIPGNFSDSMRFTNMTDLANELEQPSGYRDSFFTLTFKNDIRMYKKAIEIHNRYVDDIKAANPSGNWILQDTFQPFPPLFAKHSIEKGGNVLGLDHFDEPLVLWQTYLAWQSPSQDDIFHSFGESFIRELKEYATGIGADNEYVYLDYAYKSQDSLASYGKANLEYMNIVAEKYDPDRVFQTQVPGGFKLSLAGDPIGP